MIQANTHLAPEQLPNTNEQAPEPLFRGQGGAAERLPTKLHDDDLQGKGPTEPLSPPLPVLNLSYSPSQTLPLAPMPLADVLFGDPSAWRETRPAGNHMPCVGCRELRQEPSGVWAGPSPEPTWIAKVPNTMEQKMGLLKMPRKTLRSPWILRALISLKSCMSTKVLKMIV